MRHIETHANVIVAEKASENTISEVGRIIFQRLVHHIPGIDGALIASDNLFYMTVHDRPEGSRVGDLRHPIRGAIPDQRMPINPHVVFSCECNHPVGATEGKNAGTFFRRFPLQFVARRYGIDIVDIELTGGWIANILQVDCRSEP
ncbi:UNVERIFIED_ORG: hypothetical protein GGE53_003307 [Rhizobium etli]